MEKKPNVIVFDVDNTLVRGNLTILFLKKLAFENLMFFHACFFFLLRGAFLLMRQLPHMTRTTMLRGGNVYQLDRMLYKAVKKFYTELAQILQRLHITDGELGKRAQKLFSQEFVEKHVYHEGIVKIKEHLRQENTIVVLLSGSIQELLDVFFATVCKQLDNDGVAWTERFFAVGTQLHKNGQAYPCIGSEKNKFLKKLLQQKGHEEYALKFVYSDNGFMADLPLLIESTHGGALISKKSNLYDALPKRLLRSFIFLPSWKKVS